MGGVVGGAMERNFRKQQDFMLDLNHRTVERQIHMQNQMRERAQAAEIARAREALVWYAFFYAAVSAAAAVGARRTGSPGPLVPLLPLSFLLGYQADLAYGTKLARIRSSAEGILAREPSLVEMPSGVPTVSAIDEARRRQNRKA